MGTWSLRNHRALNGKSLSSSAQSSSSSTGRPRRQGVKVHLLWVKVCVCDYTVCVTCTATQLHIRSFTCWVNMRTLIHTHILSKRSCPVKKTHINTHMFMLPFWFTYTHSHRGDFPINQQQQYYPAIHCRGVIDEVEGRPDSRGSNRSRSQRGAHVEKQPVDKRSY